MVETKNETLIYTLYRPFLGTIIDGGLATYDIISVYNIRPDDFETPFERAIYRFLEKSAKELHDTNEFDIDTIVREIASEFNKDVELVSKGIKDCVSKKKTNQEEFKKISRIIKTEGLKRQTRAFSIEISNKVDNLGYIDSLDELYGTLDGEWNTLTAKFENASYTEWGGISKSIDHYIDTIDGNSTKGISSGFPIYDYYIGGGFRPGTINVIHSRVKTGKTFWVVNIASYVSKITNVLVLDTELNYKSFLPRLISNVSGVDIDLIENGEYKTSPGDENELVEKAVKTIKSTMNIHYKYVGGLSISQILSICRSFIHNYRDDEIPPLIIYDYLKITSPEDYNKNGLKEYQLIGLLLMQLQDIATRCDIPILAMSQTKRTTELEGADGTVAQSDRIEWIASSVAQLRKLNPNETQENFNRALHIVHTRFGKELNGFIPYHTDFGKAKIVEGQQIVTVTY
jgi:replicative DNA helicase